MVKKNTHKSMENTDMTSILSVLKQNYTGGFIFFKYLNMIWSRDRT